MERAAAMRPVFLSASEPDPTRSKEYWDARNLVNLREAVRALCAYVLPRRPLVFGGHPAITPLVRAMADRVSYDAGQSGFKPEILLFLSSHFKSRFPANVAQFKDTELIPAVLPDGGETKPDEGDRAMSLALMRYCMIGKPDPKPLIPQLAEYGRRLGAERQSRFGTTEFAAGVFIGGMEGVEREFNIFRYFHPKTPAWPIASTGAACIKLLDSMDFRMPLRHMLLKDEIPYTRLFEELLGDMRSTSMPPPRKFTRADHLDPPGLDSAHLSA
jgi:SLOG cluster3 family